MVWLTSLVAWPAPAPPMCVICPSCAITGAMRAIASAAPPAMMASVPVSAAPGPPDTGASTNAAPRACSCSAMRKVALISVVE